MSKETVMRRVCDLHNDREGFEVPLTVGVHAYALDLCYECQEALLAAVEPFTDAAPAPAAQPTPARRTRKTAAPRTVPMLVREWCAANGVPVSPHGKIPRVVEDQYLAAQA